MSDKSQSGSGRWDRYLGGVVRRYLAVTLSLAAAGAVITSLNAMWGPLGVILLVAVPVAAVALLLARRRA